MRWINDLSISPNIIQITPPSCFTSHGANPRKQHRSIPPVHLHIKSSHRFGTSTPRSSRAPYCLSPPSRQMSLFKITSPNCTWTVARAVPLTNPRSWKYLKDKWPTSGDTITHVESFCPNVSPNVCITFCWKLGFSSLVASACSKKTINMFDDMLKDNQAFCSFGYQLRSLYIVYLFTHLKAQHLWQLFSKNLSNWWSLGAQSWLAKSNQSNDVKSP